ncbi:MAG: anthranilate phosphoribosyltransferase [Acidobacteriota bacterium]
MSPDSTGAAPVLVRILDRLSQDQDLDAQQTAEAIGAIMEARATPVWTAAFLMGLAVKGETEEEIRGAAQALRSRMTVVETPPGVPVIDTCGTGGDGLATFNVSTASAFVVAGAGLHVAKHGNRSVSSRCGSADVLDALGIQSLADPHRLAAVLARERLVFLHAPHLHPAMRHAAPVRRELGLRTIFNLVGPLANPARVRHQLLGVFDAARTSVLARVLGRLGAQAVWAVHGADGMDELTTTGPNQIAIWDGGALREEILDARDLGISRASVSDLAGGSAEENAARILTVLSGEPGPGRDVVVLNAGAALVIGGVARDLRDGLAAAAASIDSGRARDVLSRLQAVGREPAP